MIKIIKTPTKKTSQRENINLQVSSITPRRSKPKTNGHIQDLVFYDREKAWEEGKNIPPVPKDLPKPNLSETAFYIAKTRYAKRNNLSEPIESTKELFWRVAYNIAAANLQFDPDKKHMTDCAKQFYRLMSSQKFIPNTPTMLNAGRVMQQLSACFVLPIEDDMRSIAQTLVDMVMIHKSGGGCISADARVWSTFCGIEPIETLFSRATSDGRRGFVEGLGVAYDVSDLNIKTVSMDPRTGKTGLKRVSHVWKYNVPAPDQLVVTAVEGTTVQTSSWHPFMVVRGTSIVEVRADELTSGDIILGPDKAEKYWPWKQTRKVEGLKIDTDLGWLIGFTLGDGSFGYVPALRQYRVRWFSGTLDVLEKVQKILTQLDIKVKIQKDKRGLLSISTLNQKFVQTLLLACGLEKFGPKDDLIRVPEVISKSPLPVVKSFLAGLMDSDGFVATDGSPSYCSVSQAVIEDLAALVSLLGYHPSVKEKAPYGRGKLPTHTLQICPLPQVNQLSEDLMPYLANNLRRSRLQSSSRRQTSLPLNFRLWRDKLVKLDLSSPKGVKKQGVLFAQLSVWASHNRVRRDHIRLIARHLLKKDKNLADLLERIAHSGQEVKTVKKAVIAKSYYDLSVDDWNTYAAGQSGLVMIHNTGFSFSRLRPFGDNISSSGGTTVGPTSFLQAYNDVTSQIKQGGVRRGANMGILHITHPDILRFAVMKVDEFSLTNFNISVSVTEDWMEQVKKDSQFVAEEPKYEEIIEEIKVSQAIRDVDLKLKKVEDGVKKLYDLVRATNPEEGYELINPRTGQATDRLNAKKVFLLITRLAWHYGDPGMIIIDRINKSPANPTPQLGMIESTNPCGEQPLLPYDACTLGAVNVGKFVVDKKIDWQGLTEAVKLAVNFLDNVLDMNNYPIQAVNDMTRKVRRIGLGVMGFADLLVQMEIGYNTDEGLKVAEELMGFIQKEARVASLELGKTRGIFLAWEGSIYDPKSPYFCGEDLKLRNGAITTIAPTGTTAMLADASSGIEPYFGISYAKNTIEGKRLFNTNPFFLKVAEEEGFYSEELLEKIEANNGSVQGLAEVPVKWQKVFVVAHDISPKWHVKIQAAFQKHVDNAISKTINFSHEASVEDVRETYMMVYELGCKGVTIYRDGSREKQILEVKKDSSYYDQLASGGSSKQSKNSIDADEKAVEEVRDNLSERPMILRGRTYKVNTPVGKAFVTINRDEKNRLFEVFISIGKAGMHTAADAEAIGRLVSLALRISRKNAAEIAQEIVAQLRGIGGSYQIGFGKERVMSLADAVAKALSEELAQLKSDKTEDQTELIPLNLTISGGEGNNADLKLSNSGQEDLFGVSKIADFCPECGQATFVFVEGCKKCHSCGYSMC